MVLVTGGTGLVGAHLLLRLTEEHLAAEQSVLALYRTEKAIEKTRNLFKKRSRIVDFEKIKWVLGDITDIPSLEIAFQQVTHVYHCAALISFDPKDEEKLRKINIEGTANIVNLCLDSHVKKLVYVSSIAALGNLAQNETSITENTEWNPEHLHSDYAISKYGAELEVWRGHQEGLSICIINPGVILGDGFWNQGSGMLFSKIKKGLPFYTTGSTGYVAVSDVVSILTQLMNSDINNERFIVVAENRTYQSMISTISKKIKAKKPSIEAKWWLLRLAYQIDWLLHFLFRTKRKITKINANSLVDTAQFSSDKIKTWLSYTFVPIDAYLDTIGEDFMSNPFH